MLDVVELGEFVSNLAEFTEIEGVIHHIVLTHASTVRNELVCVWKITPVMSVFNGDAISLIAFIV